MSESAAKPRCFVISPIGDDRSVTRRDANMVLHSIIERGLKPDFEVIRSDAFGHSEIITNNIINAITTYELAVADLSDFNPNVFYELGLRHMVEKPVIAICREGTKIPFDNLGVSTIFYDVADYDSHIAAADKIAASARKMVEPGYSVSNPVISARGMMKLANSADNRDRIVVELSNRIASMEQKFERLASATQAIKVTPRALMTPSDRNESALERARRILRQTDEALKRTADQPPFDLPDEPQDQ